jgi:hypothetical protein
LILRSSPKLFDRLIFGFLSAPVVIALVASEDDGVTPLASLLVVILGEVVIYRCVESL